MEAKASPEEARVNPRTRRVRQTVLDAAIELLLAHGAHEITAARVAEHADVARTTIYRHWPDQASLLLATIDALTAAHRRRQSSGNLETDLRSDLRSLHTRLVVREVRSVFGALAAYSPGDDAFATAQRRFIERLVEPLHQSLQAAQERGEVDTALDCELEAHNLAGPLLYRHLVMHVELTENFVDDVARRWLANRELA